MGLNLFDSMGNAVPTGEVIERLTEWYDCENASAENEVFFETVSLVKTILTKAFSPADTLDLYTDSEIVEVMDHDDLGHIAHAILQNHRSQVTFGWDVKPSVMEAIVHEYLSAEIAEKERGAVMSMKRMVDAAVVAAVTGRMKE